MGRGQASGGNFVEYLPSVKTGYAALRTHLGNRRRFGNPHPPPVGGRLGHQGSQGHGARAPVARAEAAAPRAADAPSQTPSARGQEGRLGSRAPPRPVGPAAAGQAPPRTDGRTGGRADGRRGLSSCSRHAPLGEDFKPWATSSPPSPRPAPATGGGAPLIGRAARRRVLIGRGASRPRFGARRLLHFVGRGGRRRSGREAEAVSSYLIGALGFRTSRASSLPGRGGGLRRRARAAAAAAVPSLKSLGLLSYLCAEETQMLASAPRLNSADRPMKTSVLRQRKGSGRKQHLLSWAWQQGRGQVVEILQSEKQTER